MADILAICCVPTETEAMIVLESFWREQNACAEKRNRARKQLLQNYNAIGSLDLACTAAHTVFGDQVDLNMEEALRQLHIMECCDTRFVELTDAQTLYVHVVSDNGAYYVVNPKAGIEQQWEEMGLVHEGLVIALKASVVYIASGMEHMLKDCYFVHNVFGETFRYDVHPKFK